MNFENTKPGSDLEGNARESEQLKIAERVPQPRRLEMPSMSDGELYLRINVPDGLQNNGQWQLKWNPEDTDTPGSIRHDRE